MILISSLWEKSLHLFSQETNIRPKKSNMAVSRAMITRYIEDRIIPRKAIHFLSFSLFMNDMIPKVNDRNALSRKKFELNRHRRNIISIRWKRREDISTKVSRAITAKTNTMLTNDMTPNMREFLAISFQLIVITAKNFKFIIVQISLIIHDLESRFFSNLLALVPPLIKGIVLDERIKAISHLDN